MKPRPEPSAALLPARWRSGDALAGALGALAGLALAWLLATFGHYAFWWSWGGAVVGAIAGAGTGLLVWRSGVLRGLFAMRLPRRVGLLLAVLLPLLIYVPSISPYVGRADTFEFQVVAPRLGIAHPSGYPLYILIGKLFSLLPLGSLPWGTTAWRVNLSSAVCGALAAGALFGALTEPRFQPQVRGTRWLHLFAAWTLAFSPTLWSRAVEAEVYALNALLVALALWVSVRRYSGAWDTARALPLMGLLAGLGLASHLTLGALLFLAFPMFLLPERPRWRDVGRALALGALGVAFYLYIPLRWPAVTGGERMSLAHFLRFITNAESGGALHPWAWYEDPARWGLVLRLFYRQVGVALVLAPVGWAWLWRRSRALAWGSLAALGAWVWFNLGFYVADPDYSAFLIPAHVVVIFWIGCALGWLYHWLLRGSVGSPPSQWHTQQGASPSRGMLALQNGSETVQSGRGAFPRSPDRVERLLRQKTLSGAVPQKGRHSDRSFWLFPRRKGFYGWVLVALAALLPLSRLWLGGPGGQARGLGRADEAWGRYVLQLPIAEGAAILADSEKFPPLYYLQQVAGLRPDLELVMLFNEAQYREALVARLNAGQAVYLARYLPGLDEYGVSSLGPLVRVAPDDVERGGKSVDVLFGEHLRLQGYELVADPLGRPMHHLTLFWHALAPLGRDLEVHARLVSVPGGAVVWQSEATRPVNGYTTTQAWRAGTQLADYHALAWPAWLEQGTYRLEMAVTPRFADAGLPVQGEAAAEDVWYALDEVQPVLPEVRGLYPALGRFSLLEGGTYWLLERELPGEVVVGSRVEVLLTGKCRGADARDIVPLTFRWRDDAPIFEAAMPQRCGEPGRPFVRRYQLPAPREPGTYALEVVGAGGGPSVVLSQDMLVTPDAGLANYGQQIALLDAEVDAGDVAAGGPLRVALRWRGLRAMDADYTMFLQVIGPDGQLYGQVDSWPAHGARPTSGWQVGEELHDEYEFYLKEDAPPGEYDVIVGWYLLADMKRLPVVDAAGQPISDFYAPGTFMLK